MRNLLWPAFLACLGSIGTAFAAPSIGQQSQTGCASAAASPRASQIEFAGATQALAAAGTDARFVVGASGPTGLVVNVCPVDPTWSTPEGSPTRQGLIS